MSAEFLSPTDSFPVRPIKGHTDEKFYLHGRYGSINTAMKKQWVNNRGYLELMAGSGITLDLGTTRRPRPLLFGPRDASPASTASSTSRPIRSLGVGDFFP